MLYADKQTLSKTNKRQKKKKQKKKKKKKKNRKKHKLPSQGLNPHKPPRAAVPKPKQEISIFLAAPQTM